MIIKRLTMTNFGVYAGVNSFEFTHKQPIVLIGGMNGRGKTTFLEAILLSLYGASSAAYKESSYRTYGKYLRSYINNENRDKTTSVELEFIMNESSNTEYLIRREWNALSKKTEEKITVWEDGIYSDFLTKNWAMFIENILPGALSRFFFFDGEKIAELAVDDTSVQLKESIRSMLGIDTLLQEKESFETELSYISGRIDEVKRSIEEANKTIGELHKQYEIKGGDVIEQRQELMQRRSDILAEIEQNRNDLLECAAGELPLFLVRYGYAASNRYY